jgi:transposase InsO family protein
VILKLRERHSTWGGRKLKRRLEDMGYHHLPSVSTITAILRRNSQISALESQKRKAYERFCAEHPNDLWQMDFKSYFPILDDSCYPLTILDDHSRFSLVYSRPHQ